MAGGLERALDFAATLLYRRSMATNQAGKRPQLPGLTGLRGVGALWVLLYHVQYGYGLPVLGSGFLGVDLFFILSGFVLSYAHADAGLSAASYGAFIRARFARIFPLHLFALALLGIVLWAYPTSYNMMPGRFSWPTLLTSILLVQNWGWGWSGPWNLPAWSLSAEWLMSILFPGFVVLARPASRTSVAAAMCLMCLLGLGAFLVATGRGSVDVIGRPGVARAAFEFASGCFLYRACKDRRFATTGLEISGGVLVAAGLALPRATFLAVLGFPLLIAASAQSSGRLAGFLARPAMAFFGEISFSLYLLHWVILAVFRQLQSDLSIPGLLIPLWLALYFLLTTGLSYMTYRWIEQPARSWLRGRPVGTPFRGVRHLRAGGGIGPGG